MNKNKEQWIKEFDIRFGKGSFVYDAIGEILYKEVKSFILRYKKIWEEEEREKVLKELFNPQKGDTVMCEFLGKPKIWKYMGLRKKITRKTK